ncbi:expressed unknown protein [Seminavis robusta]|uniref:Helicase-associated domain-containing protein n=1 Tax=Seminavis robusta TaxID=568900 RepID=A0A9N8HU76_9STRA|nr:expressed unknown protein [Seminavis robusta]|eukprot:Sro1617_g286290.1 n/a (880) ;mRNA; r:2054-5550
MKRRNSNCSSNSKRAAMFAETYATAKTYRTLSDNDVLFGRGTAINDRPGNLLFREDVERLRPDYLEAERTDKTLIARRVVQGVKQRGGRFMKQKEGDASAKLYVEVGVERAVEKCQQALRENKWSTCKTVVTAVKTAAFDAKTGKGAHKKRSSAAEKLQNQERATEKRKVGDGKIAVKTARKTLTRPSAKPAEAKSTAKHRVLKPVEEKPMSKGKEEQSRAKSGEKRKGIQSTEEDSIVSSHQANKKSRQDGHKKIADPKVGTVKRATLSGPGPAIRRSSSASKATERRMSNSTKQQEAKRNTAAASISNTSKSSSQKQVLSRGSSSTLDGHKSEDDLTEEHPSMDASSDSGTISETDDDGDDDTLMEDANDAVAGGLSLVRQSLRMNTVHVVRRTGNRALHNSNAGQSQRPPMHRLIMESPSPSNNQGTSSEWLIDSMNCGGCDASSPSNQATWEQFFVALVHFKEVHGHCAVPPTAGSPHAGSSKEEREHARLADFASVQRHLFREIQAGRRAASDEDMLRFRRLQAIGFAFDYEEWHWSRRYDELVRQRNATKSGLEVDLSKSLGLAVWVKEQRRLCLFGRLGRIQPMRRDRVEKLAKMNFEWAIDAMKQYGKDSTAAASETGCDTSRAGEQTCSQTTVSVEGPEKPVATAPLDEIARPATDANPNSTKMAAVNQPQAELVSVGLSTTTGKESTPSNSKGDAAKNSIGTVAKTVTPSAPSSIVRHPPVVKESLKHSEEVAKTKPEKEGTFQNSGTLGKGSAGDIAASVSPDSQALKSQNLDGKRSGGHQDVRTCGSENALPTMSAQSPATRSGLDSKHGDKSFGTALKVTDKRPHVTPQPAPLSAEEKKENVPKESPMNVPVTKFLSPSSRVDIAA